MIEFVSHFNFENFILEVRSETLIDCSFYRKVKKNSVLVLILINSCCVALLMTTLLN